MAIINVSGVQESDGEVFKILPAGLYPGEVVSSEWDTIKKEDSKYKGTTMLIVGIRATDPETEIQVTARHMIMIPDDNLTIEEARKSLAKLKRLQEATGMTDMGNAIDNEAFMYAELQVELGVMPAKDDFPEKNVVRDVLPR